VAGFCFWWQIIRARISLAENILIVNDKSNLDEWFKGAGHYKTSSAPYNATDSVSDVRVILPGLAVNVVG